MPEGLKGIFAHNIEFINKALANIEVTARSTFKNALSRTLMDLSFGNQNKDMSKISSSLNQDISMMKMYTIQLMPLLIQLWKMAHFVKCYGFFNGYCKFE